MSASASPASSRRAIASAAPSCPATATAVSQETRDATTIFLTAPIRVMSRSGPVSTRLRVAFAVRQHGAHPQVLRTPRVDAETLRDGVEVVGPPPRFGEAAVQDGGDGARVHGRGEPSPPLQHDGLPLAQVQDAVDRQGAQVGDAGHGVASRKNGPMRGELAPGPWDRDASARPIRHLVSARPAIADDPRSGWLGSLAARRPVSRAADAGLFRAGVEGQGARQGRSMDPLSNASRRSSCAPASSCAR